MRLCSSLRPVRCVALAGLGALALAGAGSLRAETITGVCPDGSVFIVKRAQDIPCSGAKRVEPSAVPPLNPEFLPRPYAWDVFQRESDPNNPYNLIDSAPAPSQPAPLARTPEPAPAPTVAAAPPQVAAAPPTQPGVQRAQPTALEIGLSSGELEQLGHIVEAWQEYAPATLVRPGSATPRGMLLRVARSAALEERVAAALARRGTLAHGAVLAFQGVALEPGEFFGNLTFVQGHVAFHPDPADPLQFGVLSGAQGPLAAGASVLGYVVLPAHVDLAKPLDVYWDDRRITATLRPQPQS